MVKKLLAVGIILLLVCMSIPSTGKVMEQTSTISFDGNIFYVGGSGPGNYTKIQDAIDNTSDGDTVFVYDDLSPYYERIQINTSISLIGEDRNTTIIDAKRKGNIIFISSNNVSIKELTLENTSGINNASIKIDFHFGFCTISDNIIADNGNGVSMYFAGNNNIIKDNIFFDNSYYAIKGSHSHSNMISGNTIDNPPGTYPGDGIFFFDFTDNNISGNTIKNYDSGIDIRDGADYNIILNNEISSNEGNGISISKGSNNKIIGNNISYNEYFGIEIQEGNGNTIYHNNLVYNSQNAVDIGNNTWDDGKYGNYWSDYKDKYPDAKKLKKEGIWDTPYEIPGGDNKDNYPLINQYPKSVIKTKSRDKPFILNFPLLSWLLEHFPNAFPLLRYIKGLT